MGRRRWIQRTPTIPRPPFSHVGTDRRSDPDRRSGATSHSGAQFWRVSGWALLEYPVIAGVLVYIFVRDDTPGGTLAIFVASLVIFAVDIPMMFGFAVARYQPGPASA